MSTTTTSGQSSDAVAAVLARVHAVVDDDSFIEVGAQARSQSLANSDTPRDGVICGFGRVEGREVAVLAEVPEVLARTDGEVGRAKRLRLLTQAAHRGHPLLFLADGAEPRGVAGDSEHGLLDGYADPRPLPDLRAHRAAVVTAVMGSCVGQEAHLALRSDVIVMAPGGTLGAVAAGTSHAAARIRAADEPAALAAARTALALLPDRSRQALPRERVADVDPSCPLTDAADGAADGEQVLAGLLDDRRQVRFGPHDDANVLAGIGTIANVPVCFAIAVGPSLTTEDLRAMAGAVRLAGRFELPLLTVQDVDGFDRAHATTPEFLALLDSVTEGLRRGRGGKLGLVTGRGHVLGLFPLGGRRAGFDVLLAWPEARIEMRDRLGYVAEGDVATTAFDAAGMSLIDDVVARAETRAAVARYVGLFAAARGLPSLEDAHGTRYIDMYA